MTPLTVEAVAVTHCDFEAKVKVGGSGPPLVYFHGAGGPGRDAFLDALAERHTVFAPDHPGTGDTARESIYAVESLWDLVLIYDELLDRLGLDHAAIVGSSFGGMVSCEVAAHRRSKVSKLVLLDPIGLWRDDAPVVNWMLLRQEELLETLFTDLEAAPVKDYLTLPEDPDELAIALADSVWAVGATGKFVWPIPDKGLDRRLHRITAETLIVWGGDDRLIPSVYAQEFADRIAGARVEIVEGAGHVPQWERLDTVAPLVLDFLAEQ